MLVKTRILHETKLPSVIQVPYSSTFVKITAVHVHITFTSKVFIYIYICRERERGGGGPKLGRALDSMEN